MSETEFEIEYLDEDEDVVSQCVQATASIANVNNAKKQSKESDKSFKTKRKFQEDDEYIPEVSKKKKKQRSNLDSKNEVRKETIIYPASKKAINKTLKSDNLTQRKLLQVKLPDYEDPLCLPVNSQKIVDNDQKRLKKWNNMCLDQFALADKLFRPDSGEESVKSTRTLVFKNVESNSIDGRIDCSIWSKTTCEDESGERKSAIFQCILPKYKAKIVPRNYTLVPKKFVNSIRHKNEMLLNKEVTKDGASLVVYTPTDFVSAVYNFEECKQGEAMKDVRRRLRELTVCKMCALCYQTSWRGFQKTNKKAVPCSICSRSQVSVYSLLTHLKSHSPSDVREKKDEISKVLANIVDYHYTCRICQQKFNSIKTLRKHVPTHRDILSIERGVQTFYCEVSNHTTT